MIEWLFARFNIFVTNWCRRSRNVPGAAGLRFQSWTLKSQVTANQSIAEPAPIRESIITTEKYLKIRKKFYAPSSPVKLIKMKIFSKILICEKAQGNIGIVQAAILKRQKVFKLIIIFKIDF